MIADGQTLQCLSAKAGSESVFSILPTATLAWSGHVIRVLPHSATLYSTSVVSTIPYPPSFTYWLTLPKDWDRGGGGGTAGLPAFAAESPTARQNLDGTLCSQGRLSMIGL